MRFGSRKPRKKPMDGMTQLHPPRPRMETADRNIDENLKRAFEEIANEPVPDWFTYLLKQLKEKGASTPAAPEPSEKDRSDD